MKINWEVRFKSKTFWVSLLSFVLLLITQVLYIFNIKFDGPYWFGVLAPIIDTIFGILTLLGIVVDHTTKGIDDTKQALSYTEPRSDSDVNTVLDYVNSIKTEEVPECNSETIEK